MKFQLEQQLLLLAVQERLAQQLTNATTTIPHHPQPTAPISPSLSIWQQLVALGLLSPSQLVSPLGSTNAIASAGPSTIGTAVSVAAPLELMQPNTSAPISPSHPLYQHGLCAWPQCNQVDQIYREKFTKQIYE